MEVMVPVQDFHFDSTTTSPYVSAPSSPKRFGDPFDYYYHYTSAPTSPSRTAAIYAHFGATGNNISPSSTSTPPAIPFDWEEKPDAPKSADDDDDDDFEFDFSGQLQKGGLPPALTAADQLFEKGKIRPLKPPPRLQHPLPDDRSSITSSPRSPKSPRPRGLSSPRRRGGGGGQEFDPFTAAMVEVTRDRGRERSPFSPSSSRSRKGSRSLSPLRGDGVRVFQKPPNMTSPTPSTSSTTTPLKSGGSKKWRLRDLLLFRSASEGRATGDRSKDPLRKYTMLSSPSSLLPPSTNKRGMGGEDPRNSSFRSTDSNGSMRRGSGAAVSAHKMHYTANRTVSEELKKTTPLPYRQGLFGCLRFNPAINSITRGVNSYSFNHKRY